MSLRLRLLVAIFVAASTSAEAYQPDFMLMGTFLVEPQSTASKEPQIWDIKLMRGLLKGEPPLYTFSLVIMRLAPANEKDTYYIKHVQVQQYEPNSALRSLRFANDSFSFKFGVYDESVKVDFNKDGSLADISGFLFEGRDPKKLTAFRLSKTQKDIRIVQHNEFLTKGYAYHNR